MCNIFANMEKLFNKKNRFGSLILLQQLNACKTTNYQSYSIENPHTPEMMLPLVHFCTVPS